jgi:hypothetical protein
MTRAQSDARAIKRATANVLAIYLDASELTQEAGRRWYAEERQRCADFARRHSLTLQAVAGAAAAISPGMRWELVYAHLLALLVNPESSVPTYSREFVRRAVACLTGADPREVLGGPKVTAFYGLLSGTDLDAVVIDGHAWNIARGECMTFRNRPGYSPPARMEVTPRRWRIAVAAYREAAEVLGEPAHSVQAATWIHWKYIHSTAGREPGED